MLLLGFLLAVAAGPRPFAEERDLLDRRLLAVQRALPDGPHPAADMAQVRAVADAARLRVTSITARPPAETTGRGEIAVELVAFGRFTNVESFFRQAGLVPRIVDVVSLALAATPEDTIRMTAVLRLPFWPTQNRLPAPPEGTAERTHGVPRVTADQFAHDQALLVAKTDALVELRRTRRNPRLFLSELASAAEDRPVVLTEISWGDELFVLRGLSVGEGPTRALERRLERGFFRVSEFLMARQGACRRFEARGRCPIAGSEVVLAVAHDDPFRQDESPCRVDRDTGAAQTLRAAGAKVKTAPGPITIRGHDLDAVDLLFVLHDLTGQSFIIDDDVRQRLTVELVGMTLEEALAALAKVRIYVGPPSPLRRVSSHPLPLSRPTSPPAPAPTPEPTAATPDEDGDGLPDADAAVVSPVRTRRAPDDTRLSLSVKRATVREILAALAQADPTARTVAPAGTLGRATIWARNIGLPSLRAIVLEAAGLLEVQGDDGVRAVQRIDTAAGAGEALLPIDPAPPLRRLTLRPADLTPDDFDLAAIGGDSGAWRAFAYSPAGTLHPYRSGEALADGSVRAIEATSALLEGEDGPIWVRIPAMP
jgi:Pilus assembly protein, PilO